MSNTVIKVENLSKKYIINHQQQGRYTALRDVIAQGARNVGRKILSPFHSVQPATTEEFFALKDVSFEIKQGDRVGIIGRNGAGKSTLLKILSRITEPTCGRIEIAGRVTSLLEVGTGFHPELTGRENIFLNGAILGMHNAEIKKKFDGIVDFAGIEKFLDTPVKRYSSGMYIRLAFAVAAYLETEVLLVDEVLAVGDVAFQKKCMEKMGEVVKTDKTIVFVSHNMAAVRQLCAQSILLDGGHKVVEGLTDEVVERYLMQLKNNNVVHNIWPPKLNPPEYRDLFRIERVIITKKDGVENNIFAMDEDICMQVFYRVHKFFQSIRFSIHLKTIDGVFVFSSTDADTLPSYGYSRDIGAYATKCWIPGNLLSATQYTIHLGAYLPPGQVIAGADNVASFQVVETQGPVVPKMQGVISPILNWEMEKVADG